MTKRLTLALGCFALLVSFTSIARADAITFTFIFGGPTTVNNPAGLTAGPGVVIVVSDANTLAQFPISGSAHVSTGTTSSWSVAGGVLNAAFNPGGTVSITAPTGVCPPDCGPTLVTGTMETGSTYDATLGGGNGSFAGLFAVSYVNPKILALFGFGPGYLPDGSVSLNTGKNKMSGKTDNALLAGGAITINTPVPEPGNLALLGVGVLGLAGVIRRKMS